MIWNLDEWLLTRIAIVVAAGIAATSVATGRVCLVHSRQRVFPGWRRFFFGAAGAALLAFSGGALAAGMLVEPLRGSPMLAWASGSLLGVGCDLASASGPVRLLQLALALMSRMAESARRSLDSRDSKPPTDLTPDD